MQVSGGPRRFREQRWLVDETIRTQTIEFDQPRLAYHLGPAGDEMAAADMAVIRNAVRKLADHVPVVRGVALRREKRARQADDAGHPQTAAAHWYAAAQLWSLACWPVWDDDALARDLDDRKNAAYLAWGARCGHIVQRADIPFRRGSLAAWFHRPAGAAGPLPTLVACGGMDAPREVIVARAGDPWLARGLAGRPGAACRSTGSATASRASPQAARTGSSPRPARPPCQGTPPGQAPR